MTESEYLVYYDGKGLYLHHIQSKTNVKTIPIDFVPEDYALTDDESSTNFTFRDGQFIIVTDKNGRHHERWSSHFVIIRLDRQFKQISCVPYAESGARPIRILEKHIEYITFNDESVYYQFRNKGEKLPYEIAIQYQSYYNTANGAIDPTVGHFCYDPFDNAIVITFIKHTDGLSYRDLRRFEIWKKHEREWELDRQCGLLKPFEIPDTEEYLGIKRLECTKQFIIVVTSKLRKMYSNQGKQIVVIDKYKLEVVNVIDGLQASYCCDYDLDKKMLSMLVEINELKGLCLSLLKLILLYVG